MRTDNKPLKWAVFETFEPADGLRWTRCPECGRGISVYGEAKAEPLTFGSATDKPETQSHWCLVSCRCGKTTVKAYGRMQLMAVKGCFGFAVTRERVYDKPCFCEEQKGSEPGHVHASAPASDNRPPRSGAGE